MNKTTSYIDVMQKLRQPDIQVVVKNRQTIGGRHTVYHVFSGTNHMIMTIECKDKIVTVYVENRPVLMSTADNWCMLNITQTCDIVYTKSTTQAQQKAIYEFNRYKANAITR